MPEETKGQTLQGVETAFMIVRHLRDRGPKTVTELASSLDLPKSTAYIHLKTMYEAGYLYKEDNEYRLSLQFLDHGVAVRQNFDIFHVAESEIDALAEETGEVANLGVEENGKRVLLYISEGRDAIYDNAQIGEFTNMHWTSLGKALLAHQPEERIQEIIDTYSLPESTAQTITEPDVLFEDLAKIRDQGYAIEDEEHWESIRAVAVPILNEKAVVGAISVSGPKTRFSDERIENELLDTLRNHANVIELKLTHY
ncbi:IclR family transcriptional regulator [Haloprofundus halobius]|uniref:IclR family transcriptional regulator n=1 Tax=Haloprofundus halobius TaxID=2876194 RepID=UPI001CCBA3B1|nr:IclR family transcriptional regulator [Haloprofundus halobius]